MLEVLIFFTIFLTILDVVSGDWSSIIFTCPYWTTFTRTNHNILTQHLWKYCVSSPIDVILVASVCLQRAFIKIGLTTKCGVWLSHYELINWIKIRLLHLFSDEKYLFTSILIGVIINNKSLWNLEVKVNDNLWIYTMASFLFYFIYFYHNHN